MSNKLKVGLVMGSDSDWKVMKDAADVLDRFDIDYEVRVISAHRSPEEASEFAIKAEERGFEVIIAGAGKAAHLPGVLAAHTCLPVIGVPVKTSSLGGADSLYSIVQMPSGVPVATVSLDGSQNAALLAVQIMSVKDENLRESFRNFKNDLQQEVKDKERSLLENLQ